MQIAKAWLMLNQVLFKNTKDKLKVNKKSYRKYKQDLSFRTF